jgi:N-acetylated-alpha-linked acidic dipeptidase
VRAPLVYVNFGLRSDYEELARLGVSVKDKVVIVRVGGLWRGGKVELASEHGAKAILIYSDPREDGYYVDGTYPDGPARTPDAVQRGSVLNGKYAGDPTTPLTASVVGAQRLPIDSPESSLARIPAMPLSYADAEGLLQALGGQVVPESWRGALPLSYRTGPSEAIVHLKIKYKWDYVTIHNVIAKLKGTVWPDELVIRGNHHDGWVFGAQDPHSGHSAMLEEARMLGVLHKNGWRPKRTIIYASWDAEEQGTIGSTEFVEQHTAELRDKAVAYLNTDMLGAGPLAADGASSFARFATDIAATVIDPNSGASALERAKVTSVANIYEAHSTTSSGITGNRAPIFDSEHNRLRLGPPGYGSDHHTFVSYAGVASMNLGFGGEDSTGSYHTAYDNYIWFTRFNDPGFRYLKASAELNGVAVLRLANAGVLPMEFDATADAVAAQLKDLEDLYQRARSQAERSSAAVSSGAYQIERDPKRPRVTPPIIDVPEIDFTPLEQGAQRIEAASARFMTAKRSSSPVVDARTTALINEALIRIERSFLRAGGLPGRPFYRNELYSPGRLWDTVPFPAVGDALLDEQWDTAIQQIPLAAATLRNIADAIDVAADRFRKTSDERGVVRSSP